jgi:hypothetical protein
MAWAKVDFEDKSKCDEQLLQPLYRLLFFIKIALYEENFHLSCIVVSSLDIWFQ